MLGKLITKLYRWHTSKTVKDVKVKKLTEDQKKRKEFLTEIQRLISFVAWLNTQGLRNRRERKMFWRNVSKGESVLEDTLQNLINLYTKKKEEKENEKN